MLIERLEDVPYRIVTKAIVPPGMFGARVTYPVFPGSSTVYASQYNLHRSTDDNIRQAFMNLSNDLFHIGISDIDMEQVTVNLYKES